MAFALNELLSRAAGSPLRLTLLSMLVATLAACGTTNFGQQNGEIETDQERVIEYLKTRGLLLPTEVSATLIGTGRLDQSPILLFNKTSRGPRKLVVLVHGWGGDQLHTWRHLPLLFLDPASSPEFGGQYDVLLYTYPTGFFEGDQSLQTLGKRAHNHLVQVVAGLGQGIPSYDEVFVITHSMGALIVQWAMTSALLSEDDRSKLLTARRED